MGGLIARIAEKKKPSYLVESVEDKIRRLAKEADMERREREGKAEYEARLEEVQRADKVKERLGQIGSDSEGRKS